MPIRINLLAEAQALEESRRKDPVKRAIMGGVVLVVSILMWSGILQLKIWAARAELTKFEVQWGEMEDQFTVAASGQKELMATEAKLNSLDQLRTNRFLWGSVLDALQLSMNDVDKIRVVRVKTDQQYREEGGSPAQTNGLKRVEAQPATSIERISISIDALDSSDPAGDQVNQFKTAIRSVPFFDEHLNKTNGVMLTSLSPPQTDKATAQTYVRFTLQCLFPEKVR